MSDADKDADKPQRPHGPLRGFLKLIVEADSSRFVSSRVKSILILVGILAVFALLGYALPAWLSRFF